MSEIPEVHRGTLPGAITPPFSGGVIQINEFVTVQSITEIRHYVFS